MSLFNQILGDSEGDNSESMGEGTSTENSQSGSSQEPSWWIDEGIPGVGDRPGWLPEKFKKASDMAKSYEALEKKFNIAPDKYDFTKAEWLDPDYEPVQELAEFAKSKHVSQEVMDKMFETVGKYLDEFKVDMEHEKQQLGEGAEERLRLLDNWAQANFSEGTVNALRNSMNTADAIKAIEEMRSKMLGTNTQIPVGNTEANEGQYTREDLQQEIIDNLDRYKKDAKYRKEIQGKIATLPEAAD